MKKIKNYLTAMILASSTLVCPVLAHEGHTHEGEESSHLETVSLAGKWQVKSTSSDTHARVNPSIRFHAGHEHPEPKSKQIIILDFCTDEDEKLYGTLTNKSLIDDLGAQYKVLDSAQSEGDNAFVITLTPISGHSEEEDVVLDFTFDDEQSDVAGDPTEAVASFDGGATEYQALRKKVKVSPECKKFMRKEIKNNQN